jgi:DNA-binding SARP family transcriptional activator/Tfp pilus assembly protein PilF
MLWRVLGTLEVQTANGWTGLSAPKWRAVLAALLAEAGRVVPAEQLIDELWRDDPPAGARKLVSGYVCQLRQLTGDHGGRILKTVAPGYQLAAVPGEIDAGRFDYLLGAGRRALDADAADQAAKIVGEALAMWRGPALADVPQGPLAAAEAGRLEELRLTAIELLMEAGLRCGKSAELVPELRRLTEAQPLREQLWQQLIRALEAGGRQAEALAAYARARETIAEQLGADPGPQLQWLHQRLLTGRRSHGVPDAPEGRSLVAARPRVPRQLPAVVRHFTGRVEELLWLSALLDAGCDSAGDPVVISVVSGTAGVGKTALAVRWAHQVSHRFPDGQLYLDLRGYGPDQPVPPADALAAFLIALGVPGQEIPAQLAERAALYRSLLAGRRMLIMLDNVGQVEQVRPLLPGTAGCMTVATSRESLAGLVARDGAVRLDLDLLPLSDAVSLLQTLIGERASADPETTVMLASQCAQLPLALRVAAELANARPADSLSILVGELADQQRRLDLLEAGGDPRTTVRAVFSWSYRHLPADLARMFRLAGLHPADLEPCGAAALAGITRAQAGKLLDLLARANLLQAIQSGRYRLHDLLAAYARDLADAHDGAEECRAALTRLFDYYLYTAACAMDVLFPSERHWRPCVPASASSVPLLSGGPEARSWLEENRSALIAIISYAADEGWPQHATQLAVTVFRYLESGGHYAEISIIGGHARRAARRLGDHAAEATVLQDTCVVDLRQGRYERAIGCLREALTLHREAGDQTGEARALAHLGIADWQQGRYARATSHFREALVLYRDVGDQTGEAHTLNNLSLVELRQGHNERAADHLQQALTIGRLTANRICQAYALANLGLLRCRQGQHLQATSDLQQALALYKETGDPVGERYALTNLALVGLRLGRLEEAGDQCRRALALCVQTGEQSGEAAARNGLGDVCLTASQPADARSHYATALELSARIGDKYQQARALAGLGQAWRALGEPGHARRYLQEAHALYRDMGAPEADEMSAQVADQSLPGLRADATVSWPGANCVNSPCCRSDSESPKRHGVAGWVPVTVGTV